MFDRFEIDGKGLMALAGNLETSAEYSKRGMESALRREGFRLKNLIQDYIYIGVTPYFSDVPGSGKWKPLNVMSSILLKPISINGKRVRRRKPGFYSAYRKRKQKPFIKMSKGVRYKFTKGNDGVGRVSVGFVRVPRKILALVNLHAKGERIDVTSRMRRYFASRGIKLKQGKTEIVNPPRALIVPTYKSEIPNINKNLEKNYINNLIRYMSGAGKNMGDVF